MRAFLIFKQLFFPIFRAITGTKTRISLRLTRGRSKNSQSNFAHMLATSSHCSKSSSAIDLSLPPPHSSPISTLTPLHLPVRPHTLSFHTAPFIAGLLFSRPATPSSTSIFSPPSRHLSRSQWSSSPWCH